VVDLDASEDSIFGYAWMKVQERGIPVLSVDVITQIAGLPPYPPRAPVWDEGDASTVKGGTLGAGEYEDAVALGATHRQSVISFFLNLGTGQRMAVPPLRFDPDKTPNFTTEPYFEFGTTLLRIEGDNDSVSIGVFKVDGDWHHLEDFGAAVVDVSETDADSNPGHGADERASYDIYLYAAPCDTVALDATGTPTDGTLYAVKRVTLTTGTPATEPDITSLVLTPPDVDDDELGILFGADDDPAGYTSGLEWQYQVASGKWSVWEDITGSLSPAMTTPPTTPTAYTFATGFPARTKTSSAPPTLSVRVRGYIQNGSDVRVRESAEVPRQWVIDPPEET
jgi:hypothetical protein